MAKQRIINTKFWDDSFIRSLKATEKLLYIYLISNPLTNICGIYEISLDRIVFDTGIPSNLVEKSFKLFIQKGKILYTDGWIKIVNFSKYQNEKSPKIKKGIENELENIPCDIKAKFDTVSIPYTYPIDTLSHSNSNSNSNSNLKEKIYKKEFLEFWNLYPKKKSKETAYKSWEKLNKLEHETILKVLPDHSNQKDWIENNGKFIPYPATWLNARGWEDDIINSIAEEL